MPANVLLALAKTEAQRLLPSDAAVSNAAIGMSRTRRPSTCNLEKQAAQKVPRRLNVVEAADAVSTRQGTEVGGRRPLRHYRIAEN